MRVAINGFGRIGRTLFKLGQDKEEIDFVAINDVADITVLEYLLKHDSVNGAVGSHVTSCGSDLIVNGKRTRFYSIAEPCCLPWKDVGVDILVESTGRFTGGREAAAHILSGAGRVVISAPADHADATVIPGVNDEVLNGGEHRIISMGSCTANCVAPIMKVLDREYGIDHGFMTTVHAYTKDQRVIDSRHGDLRRGRTATGSMVPTTTGAFRALYKAMPHLRGRIAGVSVRVPTPNVSLADLVVTTHKRVDREGINEVFRDYSRGLMKAILSCEEEPLVSCDFNGNRHSCVIDMPSTRAMGDHLARIVAWYDNECGFASRLIDLIIRMAGSMKEGSA